MPQIGGVPPRTQLGEAESSRQPHIHQLADWDRGDKGLFQDTPSPFHTPLDAHRHLVPNFIFYKLTTIAASSTRELF